MPQQNYCLYLAEYTLYSLFIDELPSVILAIATTQKQPSAWPAALLRQLICCMTVYLPHTPLSSPQPDTSPVQLTARQLAVLRHMARGMTDKPLALELCISQETVRYHKKNLYRLLRAESAVQALARALQLRLISLEEISD